MCLNFRYMQRPPSELLADRQKLLCADRRLVDRDPECTQRITISRASGEAASPPDHPTGHDDQSKLDFYAEHARFPWI